jgi:hypothetical protein
MAKLDIAKTVQAQDRLLEVLENPLHRQIIENQRRHVLLEILLRWEEILSPEMTVEEPVYILNVVGDGGYLRGRKAVGDFYHSWSLTGQNVVVVENEEMLVGDRGLAKEGFMNQYFRGDSLQKLGFDIDDQDGWYIRKSRMLSFWPYDERARMIGEHSTSIGSPELIKIPADEVIFQDEVDRKLTPLLRPLPKF